MADPVVVTLMPLQARRLAELRAEAARSSALYEEACNIIALGTLTPDLLPQATVAHDGDTLSITCSA